MDNDLKVQILMEVDRALQNLDAFEKATKKTMEEVLHNQFSEHLKTDTQRQKDELEKQAAAYEKAGVDTVKLAEWKNKRLKQINENSPDAILSDLLKTETQRQRSELDKQVAAFERAGADTVKIAEYRNKRLKELDSAALKHTAEVLDSAGRKLSLLSAGIIGLGIASVKTAGDMETQRDSLEVLLGSEEKAGTLFEKIQKFSTATPFQLPELNSATQRLLAFGVAEDVVINKLNQLGNVAQGQSPKFDSLVGAYGKVKAKGKASLEELNMFLEAGVPILEQLQKQLGKTQEEMFKYISEGKVGIADIDKALEALTTGQGQFAGMLEKQSETLNGKLSTMTDNLAMAGAKLVESLLPTIKELVDWVISAANSFANLDDNTKKTILGVAAFVIAIGPTLTIISKLILVYNKLVPVMLAVRAGFAGQALAQGASTAATIAHTVATKTATIAQAALNAVMNANPIALLITGAAVATGAIIACTASIKNENKALAEQVILIETAKKSMEEYAKSMDYYIDTDNKYLDKAIEEGRNKIKGLDKDNEELKNKIAQIKKTGELITEPKKTGLISFQYQAQGIEKQKMVQEEIIKLENQINENLARRKTILDALFEAEKKLNETRRENEKKDKENADKQLAFEDGYTEKILKQSGDRLAILEYEQQKEYEKAEGLYGDKNKLTAAKAKIDEYFSNERLKIIIEEAEKELKIEREKMEAALKLQQERNDKETEERKKRVDKRKEFSDEFDTIFKSETELELAELEKQVEAYRKAGVDEIKLEQWKADQIKEITRNTTEQQLTMYEQFFKNLNTETYAWGDALKSIADNAMSGVIAGLEKIGEAWGKGEDGANAFKESFKDIMSAILNALPQLLLQAGLQVIGANLPLGIALIAASGLVAIGNGLRQNSGTGLKIDQKELKTKEDELELAEKNLEAEEKIYNMKLQQIKDFYDTDLHLIEKYLDEDAISIEEYLKRIGKMKDERLKAEKEIMLPIDNLNESIKALKNAIDALKNKESVIDSNPNKKIELTNEQLTIAAERQKNTLNNMGAGAGAGALIGTAIAPGVGTILGGVIGGIGGFIASIFGLEEGGIVTRPTLAMIGEKNKPEAVIPLSRLNTGNNSPVYKIYVGTLVGSGGMQELARIINKETSKQQDRRRIVN